MTKIFCLFLLAVAASPGFAEKSKEQYLDCLKALGAQEPVYKGTREQMNAKVLEQVQTTQGEMESYLNLPDFSPQAVKRLIDEKGASPQFEKEFTAALVLALPSLIQANSKNLENFIQLTKQYCTGFSKDIDSLLAELEPQFQNLMRLNAKVERNVAEVVERRIGWELFHPGKGEKPFPWDKPESANLRIRGYLEKKLEQARLVANNRLGRSKRQGAKPDGRKDNVHGR